MIFEAIAVLVLLALFTAVAVGFWVMLDSRNHVNTQGFKRLHKHIETQNGSQSVASFHVDRNVT